MSTGTIPTFRITESAPAQRLIQLKTAAAQFDVSVDLLRRMIEHGQLTPYRLGRRLLVDPSELLALATRNAGGEA